ncbi:hypothetical protein [Alcaligenes faecalis]|uniref:Uncharacterized protein n=1 Tax=Alcaligenes faecalis TaxID=511 RepID=A0ABY7N7G0_ALCFA|nr:hypothetical protein [Alcaligenes faecalis]WBM40016.1 hypothetical protein M2J83_09460 [Alcaligenes faecalis]
MNIIPQDVVTERLGKALPKLATCLSKAWDKYGEYPESLRVDHSSRSRASLIHDHATMLARQEFDVYPGSHCEEIRKLFLVYFDCGIVVRFKKLNENFHASNIRTQQCLNFTGQLSLPLLGDTVNLHVGYRLNTLQTDLEGIYLACPNGPSSNAWVMTLGGAAEDDQIPSIIPVTPQSPEPGHKVVTFAPRKQDREHGKASK